MSIIDQRVVQMVFDNTDFAKRVAQTVQGLRHLDQNLKLDGLATGLSSVQNTLGDLSSRFSTIGVIGMSVINSLTQSALSFGASMVSNVINPIIEGGRRRAMNIEQASFQFKGLKMDVNEAMKSANEAVLGTAFGLDEAAKVAAQFGASGMEAGEKMTAALRGISGVAALSGSSYEDVGRIFTKVAGQGRLMGDDLNSLASRGVNAAATLANAMGLTEAEVRSMVSKGKIDFQTFADAMNNAFGEHATKAADTYTGALSNMRAALARIGQNYFLGTDMYNPNGYFERQRVLFNQLKVVFDGVNTAIKPMFTTWNKFANVRMDGLVNFLAGIDLDVIARFFVPLNDALSNVIQTVHKLFTLGKNAFTDIFNIPVIEKFKEVTNGDGFTELVPESTIELFDNIAQAIKSFTEKLIITDETADKISRTFRGLFSVFGIGWEIVKKIASVFGTLTSAIFDSSGGVLGFTAQLGDLVYGFYQAVKNGDALSSIFGTINKAITLLFDGIRSMGSGVTEVLSTVSGTLKSLWEVIRPYLEPIINTFENFFRGLNFGNVAVVTAAGFIAFAATKLQDLFSISRILGDGKNEIVSTIQSVFGAITTHLEVMQAQIKANTIAQIAIALGILAGAIFVLSTIEPEKLATALAGIAAIGGLLLVAIKALSAMSFGKFKPAQLSILAGALVTLAVAVTVLSVAMKILSTMSWEELVKGLVGVAGMLAALVATANLLPKSGFKMMAFGLSVIFIATGLLVLSQAVKAFGSLDPKTIYVGLSSIIGVLTVLAGAFQVMPKDGMISTSLSILIVSAALIVLSKAVEKFGSMDTATIMVGISSIFGTLAALSAAFAIMPKNMLAKSTAILITSTALVILYEALSRMGSMDQESIAKSLIMLGGSLVILAGGLKLMSKTGLGSAALVLAAIGLAALTPPLMLLGSMSWDNIGKSLLMLAGALAIFAATGLIPLPIIAGMAAFAGVLTLFGIALTIVATAVSIFVNSMIALHTAGLLGKAAIEEFSDAVPAMGTQVGLALTNTAEVIGDSGPTWTKAMGTLLNSLLDTVVNGIPKFVNAGRTMVMSFLTDIRDNIGEFIEVGADILINLIDGITEKLPQIAESATKLVVAFLDAVAIETPKIITAGADLVISLATSIASERKRVSDVMVGLILDAITDMGANAVRIADVATTAIVTFIEELDKNQGRITDAAVTLIVHFVEGIGDNYYRISDAIKSTFSNIVKDLIFGNNNKKADVENAGKTIAKNLTTGMGSVNTAPAANGLVDSSRNNIVNRIEYWRPNLYNWGSNMGWGVVQGISSGMQSTYSLIAGASNTVGSWIKSTLARAVGYASPAKEMMPIGEGISQGLMVGMTNMERQVKATSGNVGYSAISGMRSALSDVDKLMLDYIDLTPVITPIVDLTKLKAGVKDMATLYDSASTVADILAEVDGSSLLAGASERQQIKYEFNQTITSPKAVSAVDVYKDTKSLISYAKNSKGY